jgi:phage terminase large subunit-like protein
MPSGQHGTTKYTPEQLQDFDILYAKMGTWKKVAEYLGEPYINFMTARRLAEKKFGKDKGRKFNTHHKPKAPGEDIKVGIPRDCIPLLNKDRTGEKGWLDYFYASQRGFCVDPNFITFFLGGNGTGKTRIGAFNVIAHAAGVHPKRLGLPPMSIRCVAPSFEDGVKKIMLPKFYDSQLMPDGVIMGPMLPQSIVRKNFDDRGRKIVLKNDSIIEFMTHDQSVLQHAGAERDGIWWDEEPPKKLWNEGKARLRAAKGGGKMWLTMTPPFDPTAEPSWTGEELYKAKPGNVGIYTACMADNPAITKEFIDQFTLGMTPEEVDVRVYGRYPIFGKVVYPYFRDNYFDDPESPGNLIRPFDLPSWWKRVGAVDHHPSKACAALWGTRVSEDVDMFKAGDVIIYQEMGENETQDKPIRMLADIMKQKEGSLRPDWRVFDQSMDQQQQGLKAGWSPTSEFAANGIFFAHGADRKWETGWSITNQYLQAAWAKDTVLERDPTTGRPRTHPRVFIFDTCLMTRNSLRSHTWIRRGLKTEPGQRGKDHCDCLRYILQEFAASFSRLIPWDQDFEETWEPPRRHTAGLYGDGIQI